MTRPWAAQVKCVLFGAALGAVCTVASFKLAQPARTLLSRVARLAGRAPNREWVDSSRSAPSGTRYETFFSPTVGSRMSYLLYLPPDYVTSSGRRYPVIYWLHGRGGNQEEGAATFVPRLDAAIRAGKAPPLIIVLPNGLGYNRWVDTSDGAQPLESAFIQDLIPHVDRTYRTIATRQGRAIEGFSMGGFGAAHLGFKYPEIFGVIALDSAALFDESTQDAYLKANSPWSLAVRNADAIRGRTIIRLAVGDQDSLFDLNRNYHLLLEALGIRNEFAVFHGVGHDEVGLYRQLGDRLATFYTDALLIETTSSR